MTGDVLSLSYKTGTNHLLAGDQNGIIRRWDITDGSFISMTSHTTKVLALSFI